MPSDRSFSIFMLIESWNASGRQPQLVAGYSDVHAVAEALINNMQLKQYATRCVFSKFQATFNCTGCGTDHLRVKNWDGQLFSSIPLLQLPANDVNCSIPHLLASYLDTPFDTRCSNQQCRQGVSNGRFETVSGYYTVLAVNRVDDATGFKKMNKLTIDADDTLSGYELLGELISCISHRGSVNRGHFVSYQKVGSQWFINDDSSSCVPCANPLCYAIDPTETVDLLFFMNNIQS